MFDKYPYTDFHELNLDWIIKKVKELSETVAHWIAFSEVKFADPIEWNPATYYPKNTIALWVDGNTYITKEDTPVGIPPTDNNYWFKIGNYDAQVVALDSKLNEEIANRASADNIIQEYVRDINYRMFNNGFTNTPINTIECGQGKEYTSLIDAVNFVKSENKPYIIKLYEGTYDTSACTPRGLEIPDKCYIVGVGDRTKIYITCNVESDIQSTLYLTKNNGLYNLFITGYNCRYVIHDDDDVHGNNSNRIVRDCIIQGSGLSYRYVYGAGTKGGSNLTLENCTLINDGDVGCFSVHNMTGSDEIAHVTLKGCTFFTGGNSTTTYPETVRFAGVMNYEGRTNYAITYVSITDCENVFINLDTEFADPVHGKISPYYITGTGEWGINYSNDTVELLDRINNDTMFASGRNYDSVIKGNLLFRSGPFLVKTHGWTGADSFYDGVSLTDTATPNAIVLCAKGRGVLPKSVLGVTGGVTGDSVCMVSDGQVHGLVIKSHSGGEDHGTYLIGSITDYGMVKLRPISYYD